MQKKIEGDKLILFFEGRVDSNNSDELQKQVDEAISENPGMETVIDAESLYYISSAGLRVLMRLRKQLDKEISIINVSRDVYDILEVTGFTELFDVKKAYRSIDTTGMEVIGKGFFGTVYRMDDETIVKMYKGKDSIPMIENERKMARKAFVNGIPTAISYDIVKVNEDYGSVFELLNARTFHELAQSGDMPLSEVIAKYIELLKLVHRTSLELGEFPSYKERFMDYLEIVSKHLDSEQYDALKKMLTSMKDENTVVHGDIQMKNVMMVDGEPMLIDMDTLGLGNPVFEFAGLYVTYWLFEEDDPDNAMSFLNMTNEFVEDLWNRIFEGYFDFKDDTERKETLAKITLVAVIRFLYLLETTDLKNSDLGRRRIAHSREHIDQCIKVVDNLSLGGYDNE